MRKLVLVVIALLALFALFRAYSDDTGPSSVRPAEKSAVPGLGSLASLLGGGTAVGFPVVVSSPRRGDIVSVGGHVSVDSRVEGDVWVLGADVELSPRAEVTGDVVVIGGRLDASPGSVVEGSVSQIARLKAPFFGILGTKLPAQAAGLAGVVLGYVLFGFALFLAVFFLARHVRQMEQGIPTLWRQSLITVVLSLVVVPLLTALALASAVGVLILPVVVLAVLLLALDGFLALCVRVGALVRSAGEERGADQSLFMFTSGLLTLFLVNVPALVGILLTAFRSTAATRIGVLLQALSLWLTLAGLAYGFGLALSHTRARAAG